MSYMSQNFCLIGVSNLSFLNFRIFLLMYPGSKLRSRHNFTARTARRSALDVMLSRDGSVCGGTAYHPVPAAAAKPRRPVLDGRLSRRTLGRRGTAWHPVVSAAPVVR